MAPVRHHVERDEQGAPKSKVASGRMKKGVSGFFADREKVTRAKEDAKISKFYDHNSPMTRMKRQHVQTEYEWAMKEYLEKDVVLQSEIYNSDTFKEYTKLYLSCCAAYIEGKIGAKPKACTLFYRLRGLLWWAFRRMEDFDKIYRTWYEESLSHIYFLANTEGFEASSREKNELGEVELALFFRTLLRFDSGRKLWKQAYLSWLLVFMCGVRPGSFTVGKGYEKGASIGDGTTRREEDQTLRWSDCEFRRVESGIAVRVTFRFLKGNRDPHTQKEVPSQKTWTFLPIGSDRYEFDLALMFAVTAFGRGLFRCDTLEQLFDGSEMFPPIDPVKNTHPVFLKAEDKSALSPDVPMRLGVVNNKLQDMCKYVGLFARNTIYSFRRTMIQEVRRKHGTEYAKDAATHKQDGNAIEAYDNVGQADIDWVADRLDEGGLSRKDIRALYSQIAIKRVVPPEADREAEPLADVLKRRVDGKIRADPAYQEVEADLQAEILNLAQVLQESPVQNSRVRVFSKKLAKSDDPMHAALLEKLDSTLASRTKLHRQLRRTHDKAVQREMQLQSRSELQIDRVDSNDCSPDLDTSIGEDDPTDTDLEPDSWSDLPDNMELRFDEAEGGDDVQQDGRLAFAQMWHSYDLLQLSGLSCLQCALDDTVDDKAKSKLYSASYLDRHLKTTFHSRKGQLHRAFDIDKDGQSLSGCPLCDKTGLTRARFIKHVEEEHPEQL